MKKAIALAIVLVIVAAGMPVLLGIQTQGRITELAVTASSNPVLRFEVAEYERGWRRSRATISVALQDNYRSILERAFVRDPNQPARSTELEDILDREINLNMDVTHGPLLPRGGIGLADVATRVDPANEGLEDVLDTLVMQGRAEFAARIGFGSESSVRWTIPPVSFSSAAASLATSGLTGDGTIDMARQYLASQSRMDSLQLTNSAMELRVEDFAMSTEAIGSFDVIRPGTSVISIGHLAVETPRNDSTIMVESLEAQGKSGVNDAGELLHGLSEITVDSLSGSVNGNEHVLTDVRFDYSHRNLDMAAMNAYMDWIFEISGETDPTAILAGVQPIVYSVLTEEPEFEIGPIGFNWNDGMLEARVLLSIDNEMLPAEQLFALVDTALWTRLVAVEAELDVDRNVAEWIATQIMSRQGGPPTEVPAEIPADILQAQARGTLVSLVAQGMLEETESGYRFRGTYENGVVEVNGRVIPIGPGAQGVF